METSSIPNDITKIFEKGKVFMFSKSYCPFCVQAKKVFDDLGIKYDYIECDEKPLNSGQLQKLKQLSGISTYPNIFIGTKSVGGCSELKALKSNGKLKGILSE
mmetsp:Transcript_24549/g.21732  ORF Transcript_24549/g.21732 Transcript_24549/m.21732 type:complete len:103 (+) Transcript_24549:186-494(+)